MMEERKQNSLKLNDLVQPRFRFTDELDLYLAREVCGQNPYEEPKRWGIIQIHMIQVSVRTMKERIQNLVKKYLEKVAANEGKSGIEETVTELDNLIQQIVELMKTFVKKPSKGTIQKAGASIENLELPSSFQKGFDNRERYVASMQGVLPSNAMQVIEHNEEPIENGEGCINEISEEITIENTVPSSTVENLRTPRKRTLAEAQKNILSPSVQSKRKSAYTNMRQFTVQYLAKKK